MNDNILLNTGKTKRIMLFGTEKYYARLTNNDFNLKLMEVQI